MGSEFLVFITWLYPICCWLYPGGTVQSSEFSGPVRPTLWFILKFKILGIRHEIISTSLFFAIENLLTIILGKSILHVNVPVSLVALLMFYANRWISNSVMEQGFPELNLFLPLNTTVTTLPLLKCTGSQLLGANLLLDKNYLVNWGNC